MSQYSLIGEKLSDAFTGRQIFFAVEQQLSPDVDNYEAVKAAMMKFVSDESERKSPRQRRWELIRMKQGDDEAVEDFCRRIVEQVCFGLIFGIPHFRWEEQGK